MIWTEPRHKTRFIEPDRVNVVPCDTEKKIRRLSSSLFVVEMIAAVGAVLAYAGSHKFMPTILLSTTIFATTVLVTAFVCKIFVPQHRRNSAITKIEEAIKDWHCKPGIDLRELDKTEEEINEQKHQERVCLSALEYLRKASQLYKDQISSCEVVKNSKGDQEIPLDQLLVRMKENVKLSQPMLRADRQILINLAREISG